MRGGFVPEDVDPSAPSSAEQAQVEVTCRDLETGESDSVQIADNYVLVTAGRCEQTYVNVTYCADGSETHVITVKGARRG